MCDVTIVHCVPALTRCVLDEAVVNAVVDIVASLPLHFDDHQPLVLSRMMMMMMRRTMMVCQTLVVATLVCRRVVENHCRLTDRHVVAHHHSQTHYHVLLVQDHM
jgi:hypothetical protein